MLSSQLFFAEPSKPYKNCTPKGKKKKTKNERKGEEKVFASSAGKI